MGHPGAAVAVLLGFDCYLRISEIGGMRARDVADMSHLLRGQTLNAAGVNWRGMSSTLLSLPITKTWENQSVRVRKPEVAGLLDTWVRYVLTKNGGGESARLFPEPLVFRRMFYEAQVRLGWANAEGKVPFVPHSLRHGGASCDYLLNGARY